MFDSSALVELPLAPTVLRQWVACLAEPTGESGELEVLEQLELLEQIELLEQVKSACAARQARLSVAFDAAQRAQQRAEGVRAELVGRGIGEQIALARHESPTKGGRHLGLAKALVHEMPNTLAALASGSISEWAATVMVRETACLRPEDRRVVDSELSDRMAGASAATLRREAWALACRLDATAAVNRHRSATNDRRVSVRPAPDAMTYLSALLPVKDGVAAYAALAAAASSGSAAGDTRSRGQLMADALVDRITGRASSDGDGNETAAIEICLVVTAETLLADGSEPALVTTTDAGNSNAGADVVPGQIARDLVREAADVWVRRLFAEPKSGQLVAMESTRRTFDGQLRRLLILRDQVCRTPWCDAPIRHGDHVIPHAQGGATSLLNGQGLCVRCNQTKSLPGWRAEVHDGVVRTTTPTGRVYDSTAPPLIR